MLSGNTPACAAPWPWAADGPWWSPSGPWCGCGRVSGVSTSSGWLPSRYQTPLHASVLETEERLFLGSSRFSYKVIWLFIANCLQENAIMLVQSRGPLHYVLISPKKLESSASSGSLLFTKWQYHTTGIKITPLLNKSLISSEQKSNTTTKSSF